MMNNDTRRQVAVARATRRYGNAVRQGSIPCRADGNSAGQTYNYRTAAERSELRFTQVKQVLMEHGVPPIQFVPYRNFAPTWTNSAASTQAKPCANSPPQRPTTGPRTDSGRTCSKKSAGTCSRWK